MPRPPRPRASTTARGYGADHQRRRRDLAPAVERGEVDCWRCGQRILPGQAWDLGHDDHDRTITRGPEHAGRCNRSTAAARGNRARATPGPPGPASPRPRPALQLDDW